MHYHNVCMYGLYALISFMLIQFYFLFFKYRLWHTIPLAEAAEAIHVDHFKAT